MTMLQPLGNKTVRSEKTPEPNNTLDLDCHVRNGEFRLLGYNCPEISLFGVLLFRLQLKIPDFMTDVCQ